MSIDELPTEDIPKPCRITRCGKPRTSAHLCAEHTERWVMSPERQRAIRLRSNPIAMIDACLVDFVMRIEAEELIDLRRSMGWPGHEPPTEYKAPAESVVA